GWRRTAITSTASTAAKAIENRSGVLHFDAPAAPKLAAMPVRNDGIGAIYNSRNEDGKVRGRKCVSWAAPQEWHDGTEPRIFVARDATGSPRAARFALERSRRR